MSLEREPRDQMRRQGMFGALIGGEGPLAARSTAAEQMDTDCVDFADYQRCLRDLSRVNTVTLTHRPMLAWLARQTAGQRAFSVLDVACGHGDALRRIATMARRHGQEARLIGLDMNPWAIRAATEATDDPAITYVTGDVFAYQPEPRPDFVISAQFTHHLTAVEIVRFIRWMEATAQCGWFISDLHRHWLPYYGFPLLARAAFWHRFVREDGQISIARSFRATEWHALLQEAGLKPPDVAVTWHLPFRLCVARPATPLHR
jgi:2-polyprenyl-3-methyl-5-hydroxy-6-metoxy-1,4-benzoquinol methylase